MKVFVWARIDKATSNYHPEGGVVAFAESEQRARELAREQGCDIAAAEHPDSIHDLVDGGENVFVFPDTGCC